MLSSRTTWSVKKLDRVVRVNGVTLHLAKEVNRHISGGTAMNIQVISTMAMLLALSAIKQRVV